MSHRLLSFAQESRNPNDKHHAAEKETKQRKPKKKEERDRKLEEDE